MLSRALILIIVFNLCLQTHSQEMDRTIRAAALNNVGRFREAIEMIEPLLQSNKSPAEATIGVAWNIRGLSLQSLGDLDNARHSYETAIAILRIIPSQTAQYAAALDNLGSLKAQMGQLEESRSLRLHARTLYKSIDEKNGMARASSNLALVALAQKNRKDARRYLAQAFQVESKAAAPNISDLASMWYLQSLLDEHDGHLEQALASVDRSVDLWTQHFGSQYYMLATAYSLRGRLLGNSHNDSAAIADFEHALAILKQNNLSNSNVYFLIETSYAHILQASGKRDEAERLAVDARNGFEALHTKECRGCTVSAATFR